MVGKLIVDAEVEVRTAVDQAGKRPGIAAYAGTHAREIEAIEAIAKLGSASSVDRDIDHQPTAHELAPLGEKCATDTAAGSIGTHQQRRFEDPARGGDANRSGVLLERLDAAILDNREAGAARGRCQRCIEKVAPHDRAEHLAARNLDAADLGARMARGYADGRHVEAEAELVERGNCPWDQAAGANLGPRMMRFFERDDAAGERRAPFKQVESGGESGRAGAGD